jgi:hypothetical protein
MGQKGQDTKRTVGGVGNVRAICAVKPLVKRAGRPLRRTSAPPAARPRRHPPYPGRSSAPAPRRVPRCRPRRRRVELRRVVVEPEVDLFPGGVACRCARERLGPHAQVLEDTADRGRVREGREHAHLLRAAWASERIEQNERFIEVGQSMYLARANSSPSPRRRQCATVIMVASASTTGASEASTSIGAVSTRAGDASAKR